MVRVRTLVFIPGFVLLFSGCPGTEEATRPAQPTAAPRSLYQDAHHLLLVNERDSAEVLLERVLAGDSLHLPAWQDLASVTYEKGMSLPAESAGRNAALRKSLRSFARVEALGVRDALVYERLSEIAMQLKDNRAFLTYAAANVKLYPFDRQYYNVGLAYVEAGEFQGAIKSQKEAIEKFAQSNYIGGFYRQLGRAYMKIDRDQTAERTLVAGVKAADARLTAIGAGAGAGGDREGIRRLSEDKIGMLLMLKKLHTIYKDAEKLQRVERQLREAGYRE